MNNWEMEPFKIRLDKQENPNEWNEMDTGFFSRKNLDELAI